MCHEFEVTFPKRKGKRSDTVTWQTPYTNSQTTKQSNTPWRTKKFDYTSITGRLSSVSRNDYGHHTGEVDRFTDQTFRGQSSVHVVNFNSALQILHVRSVFFCNMLPCRYLLHHKNFSLILSVYRHHDHRTADQLFYFWDSLQQIIWFTGIQFSRLSYMYKAPYQPESPAFDKYCCRRWYVDTSHTILNWNLKGSNLLVYQGRPFLRELLRQISLIDWLLLV